MVVVYQYYFYYRQSDRHLRNKFLKNEVKSRRLNNKFKLRQQPKKKQKN